MVLFAKGAQINAGSLPKGMVPLPELGKDVHALVRGLTAAEGRALKAASKNAEDLDDNDKRVLERFGLKPNDPLDDSRFLSWVLINEDGTNVFADANDVRENFHAAQASVQAILEKSLQLSGLRSDRSKN